MEETFDHYDHHDTLAGAAAAAAGEALGELAGEKKYGSLPSWNIVVLGTVGGILFFELICHQMNHAAAGKRHAQELLETLYRELAILGIVAFILWAINVSPAVDIEYGDKHFFEQIHMALFLAALLHTFFVGVVALYSRQTDRRWDIFEDDEMRRYKDLKQQHRRTAQMLGIRHASLKHGIGWCRSMWLAVRHPILYRRLSELSEHVGYHAIRSEFIRSNKLPKNFRFASYLKKCEQSVVLDLAGIKESVWVAMVLFVGAELFVKGIFGQAKSSADVKPMFITGAVIVMVTAVAVHIKLKSIYSKIIRSYQASTDRRDEYMQFVGTENTAMARHKDFFWFSRPGFMVLALQVVQFLLAIMVGALIWFGRTDSTGIMVIAEVILGVGAFGIYTIVLPRFIPKYTTVTHVGGLVNRHILSECLVKQKKAFQHRALPPTLRQVSVMARVKADNEALYGGGGVKAFLGKVMSGAAWRQFLQVLITIHFFVVAYNTDPVEKGRETDEAFWIELCLGSVALVFWIVEFFVVWEGKPFFRFSFFTAPPKSPAAGGDNNASASVYPSHGHSRQNLLEDGKGGKDATVTQEPTGTGTQKQLLSRKDDGEDYGGDTRCSIWACFGWNGLDRPKRFFGVPPSARVGWWRTIDFILVLAVAACSITTFSVDWDYRVVHALQGLVILRWLPLLCCPLRPAPGHADLHDVGGATVHDQPLDNNTRHKVLVETLGLLRGQNKLAAMVDRNMAHDHGADITSAFSAAGHTMLRKGSIAEEKEDGDDAGGFGEAGDIANVGVAVALREACAAHPDLVQSHGPLSAPILRAMLGLDPHKNSEGHDDAQDFNVTAKAVALARGFQRADSSVAGDATTPGRGHLRRQSSAAGRKGAPPSPSRRSTSSSSSSELSSSEEEGERLARKGSSASNTIRASRARVSSWIGRGSRHSRTSEASQSYQQHQQHQQMMFQQQQQQLMYQQQQQMQLHYQLQQQQRASQQDLMSSIEGGGTDAGGSMPLTAGPLLPQMPHGYMGAPYAGVGAVGAYGLAAPLPMASFDHPSAAGGGGGGFGGYTSSSHSRSKSSRRGRSRSSRHRRSGHSGDVVVPPAVEDIERPVLRSFASDAGSQHGGGGLHSAAGTPRASAGAGPAGLSIPFGSGRSIPFSSSHRAARSGPKERGTPGRATAAARHQHRRSLSQGGGPDSGAESDILGRAATEAAEATVATASASASASSQQGLDVAVPGASDATVEGSQASAGEEGSATPAVGKSAAGSAFAGKDGKAE